MKTPAKFAALSVLACSLALAADLPVKTVVLYKHGVGYFERQGTLKPGESARLEFRADEMNDVLKSLTVTDQGGKVRALRYDSDVPLDRKLSEFPFTIGDGFAVSALIDQLKGARLEMESGPRKIAGTVVSARRIEAAKDSPEREQITLLLDSGDLRTEDLGAVSAIRFTDPKQQAQFRDYLAAVSGARSKERRSLYIDAVDSASRDSGSRNLRAEYIVPMPAWKSSYRLMFAESGAQALLEGWAIVDNTTGEDWTNVRMSLVSGKPVSFISQLYPPKYIARPNGELAEDKAVAPAVYGGAITLGSVTGQAAAPPPPPAPRMGMAGASLRLADRSTAERSTAEHSTIDAAGPAQEIGELFEYTIGQPVTVRRDESAMLPFLQQNLTTRKLSVYSDIGKANPMSAAEVTNNTGKTLDGGPITVYDAGAYAGEALVETVKAGDKRLISYGVDLGTRISTSLNSRTDDVRELHVHHGMMVTRSAQVDKRTYAIRNVDARARTLIIEHPIRAAFELVDTAKPMETARDVYRFEVKVPASGAVDFPVTAERVYDSQVTVSSLNADAILTYVRNRALSEAARAQLQKVADLKNQIAAADRDKKSVASQIAAVADDEQRNRQNIAALTPVSGQQQAVQEGARRLADQEAQIAMLRERQTELDRQQSALQTQLDGLIDTLEF